MSANLWCRLWHDMPTDPKWRTIARAAKQEISRVIAVFNFLMVEASTSASRGAVQPNTEDLATALDISVEDVEAILGAMQDRVIEEGRLSGWERRQPNREDNSTKRVQELRERRQRERETHGNAVQRNVTLDTDTDTDEDKDKEQRQELSPLSPSAPTEPTTRPEEFANTWNKNRGKLPKVDSFTDGRKKKVLTRIKAGLTIERFTEAVLCCRSKPFLCGENDRGWTATFDWLIANSENTEKAINNPYGGSRNGNHQSTKDERTGNNVLEILGRSGADFDGAGRHGDSPRGRGGEGLFADDDAPTLEGVLR